MVSGAFVSTGFFFFCFCGFCAFLGLNGRVRGVGRSKWWGVQSMRIERPPLGQPGDRGYYPTSSRAVTAPMASPGGFFATLPNAEKVLDPVRQNLLSS